MMTDPRTDTIQDTHRTGWSLHGVAVCLGASAGLHLIGIAGVYRAILDPLPRTSVIVMAVALLAAALGAWLPQRLVARRLRSASQKPSGGAGDFDSDLLPHTLTPAQQGMMWVMLAAVSLGAGTVGLLLLWATGPIEIAHRWVAERFFVGPAELLGADLVAVVAGVAVPWLIIGLALACLYTLSASYRAPGQIGGGLIGSVFIGAALGLAIGSSPALRASPGRTVLLAHLPLFIAAVVAVARASRRQAADKLARLPELQPPQCAPEAGQALLATLGVWGFLVGSSFAVWPRVVNTGLNVAPAAAQFLSAWMLFCTGIGIMIGNWLAARKQRPAGASGPWMVLAGLGTEAAIAACAIAGRLGQSGGDANAPLPSAVVLSGLAIAGLVAGGSFSHLKRALLLQAGSAAVAWTQIATAAFLGAVLGVVVTLCWIVPMAGTLVALAAAGLAALAAGGMLVIFDVGGPTKRHRWHLVGVFAALAGLMIGLPRIRPGWLRWQGDSAAVREGRWLTVSLIKRQGDSQVVVEPRGEDVVPAADQRTAVRAALRAVMRLRGRMNRCLLISTGELSPDPADAAICRTIGLARYDPLDAGASPSYSEVADRHQEAEDAHYPALLRLRVDRGQYDLIVLASVPGGHPANAAVWSVESLRRATRRLAPRGMLAGLIDPADYGRLELASIAATFVAAAPSDAQAALVGTDAHPMLILLASAPPATHWDWSAAARAGMHHTGPLKTFCRVARGARPNSLRVLSLIRLGSAGNGGLQLTDYVCQTPEWRRLEPDDRPVPIWPPSPTKNRPAQTVP